MKAKEVSIIADESALISETQKSTSTAANLSENQSKDGAKPAIRGKALVWFHKQDETHHDAWNDVAARFAVLNKDRKTVWLRSRACHADLFYTYSPNDYHVLIDAIRVNSEASQMWANFVTNRSTSPWRSVLPENINPKFGLLWTRDELMRMDMKLIYNLLVAARVFSDAGQFQYRDFWVQLVDAGVHPAVAAFLVTQVRNGAGGLVRDWRGSVGHGYLNPGSVPAEALAAFVLGEPINPGRTLSESPDGTSGSVMERYFMPNNIIWGWTGDRLPMTWFDTTYDRARSYNTYLETIGFKDGMPFDEFVDLAKQEEKRVLG